MTEYMKELLSLFVKNGLMPEDERVYLVAPMVLAVAQGNDLKDDHRNRLMEFPKLIELLEWVQANRETMGGLIDFRVTPGPEATVDTLSSALLEQFKNPQYSEPLDFGDLNWRDNPPMSGKEKTAL